MLPLLLVRLFLAASSSFHEGRLLISFAAAAAAVVVVVFFFVLPDHVSFALAASASRSSGTSKSANDVERCFNDVGEDVGVVVGVEFFSLVASVGSLMTA